MVRIPLIGIPRHLWRKTQDVVDAPAWLVVWRIIAVILFILGMMVAFSATGGSGVAAIFVAFVFTTLLSHLLADDALAIWRNIWHAEWGEVEI